MELGPQNHNRNGLLGPDSIIVVYMRTLWVIGTTTSFPPPRATIQNCSSPALRWKVKGSKAPPCFVLGAECPSPNLVKYGRGIYAPGLPPPPPLPAPRPPCPRAPEPPLLPAVPHNQNEPTQTRGRGRWRMNRIRAGTGAPFATRKEQFCMVTST